MKIWDHYIELERKLAEKYGEPADVVEGYLSSIKEALENKEKRRMTE